MELRNSGEVDGYEHIAAAKMMRISQPTFTRIIANAHKKVAEAITKGKAIRIERNS